MTILKSVGAALCVLLATVVAAAEPTPPIKGKWHRIDGSVIDGTLVEVFGGLAVIHTKNANVFVGLDVMTDDELARVNQFLSLQPAAAPLLKESTSKVARDLEGNLRSVQNGKVRAYDPGARPEPNIYLIYFSAGWCPPCHRFTPELIKAYHRIQQRYPGKVEVVLVSSDNSVGDAEKYMLESGMPWPMLRYSGQARSITQWAAKGIPCLVAVTRGGEALLHSYRGEEYVGPDDVLAKCEQLLPMLDPTTPQSLRSHHRLALQRHRATAGVRSQVKPYLLQIDQSRASFIPEKGLTFRVEVDETGKVTDATVEDQPYSPLRDMLKPDIDNWLFLPAIENGQAVKATLLVPLTRPAPAPAVAKNTEPLPSKS